MISNDRSKSIIDTMKTEQVLATNHWIDRWDLPNSDIPDTVTITLDRWVLNDLNVILQQYQKEFISNE